MSTDNVVNAPQNLDAVQTDAERLEYTATTHPAVIQFRVRENVKMTRHVLDVRDDYIQDHLTATTLAGPGAITPPPFVYTDDNAGSLLAFYHLGRKLSGHSGLVHGGISAVLMDECMGRASFPRLPGKIAVTANLNVDYKNPIRVGSIILVRASVTEVQGRKAWVKCVVEDAADGKVLAEATGLFIEPKWAASLSTLL